MIDPVRSAQVRFNQEFKLVRARCLARKMSLRQGSTYLLSQFWLYYAELKAAEQKVDFMDWFREKSERLEKELRIKIET